MLLSIGASGDWLLCDPIMLFSHGIYLPIQPLATPRRGKTLILAMNQFLSLCNVRCESWML